jgi:hypothetical protein
MLDQFLGGRSEEINNMTVTGMTPKFEINSKILKIPIPAASCGVLLNFTPSGTDF